MVKRFYTPPDEQQLHQFAREVCDQLAQKGNSAYASSHVVFGLAQFMGFIARMVADQLNQGHYELLDNDSK